MTETQRVLEHVDRALDHFLRHQGKGLHVHEQYLHQHLEYTRAFYDLLRLQSSQGGGGAAASIPEGVERSLALFNNY